MTRAFAGNQQTISFLGKSLKNALPLLLAILLLAGCGGEDSSGDSSSPGDDETVTYTVYATASEGGSIDPASRTVDHGDTADFTVTPDSGYSIDSVSGCDGTLDGDIYTTGAITDACTVTARFSLNSYTVNATAGSGGSIDPASRTVDHGDTASFTVTPDSGYSIDSVSGCDGTLDGDIYTTGAITDVCTVTASFSLNSYTVNATAGSGGSIDPASRTVDHGDTASFTVTPDSGYGIDSVSGCDGTLDGDIYTTGAITEECAVLADFVINSYVLIYTAGENGTIEGESPQSVEHGDSGSSVEAVADSGYHFVGWSDGSIENPRTDENITAELTVTANFAINIYTVTFQDYDGTELRVELVPHGEDATAPEDPERTGYTFSGWEPDTFAEITGDLTVTAQYDINYYSIGGILAGLPEDQTLTLQLNGGYPLILDDTHNNGLYQFDVALPYGSAYSVSVHARPSRYHCTVDNADGLVESAVMDVDVTCLGLSDFPVMAVGGGHTMAIKDDGSLWAWGDNHSGQLGLGDTVSRSSPEQVGEDTDWEAVSAGDSHTMAIKDDGSLWAWGANGVGWSHGTRWGSRLGLGDTDQRDLPVRVGEDNDWVAVSAGGFHSLALRADGTLWVWGSNENGQLGLGYTGSHLSPEQLGHDDDWVKVSAGGAHSLALKDDGTLWSWGYNGGGELCRGWGASSSPAQVGSDDDWMSASAGGAHTQALKTDGTLWACGANGNGQLGLGTGQYYLPEQVGGDLWESVNSGDLHTMAVRQDGTLWAWGANANGRLGLGDTTSRNTPEQVGLENSWARVSAGKDHTVALNSDGTLLAWGSNREGQLGLGSMGYYASPVRTVTGDDWMAASAGGRVGSGSSSYSLALKSDGTLWAWGSNWTGQLGVGDTTLRRSPVQVENENDWAVASANNYHSLAVKADGTLWAWGHNEECQLGLGYAGHDEPSPLQVGYQTGWQSALSGDWHSLSIKEDGSLWSWGSGMHGALGLGDNERRCTPEEVVSEVAWRSVSTQRNHNMAIKEDGSLWAWGANPFGQLGLGDDTSRRETPERVGEDTDVWQSVSAAWHHTLAIKEDGSLWSWGHNGSGQLGLGDAADRSLPAEVGEDTDWAVVAAGGSFSLAIKEDGSLWAWGNNTNGQLGLGDTVDRDSPERVGEDTDWREISAGVYHSLAIKEDGALWGWGDNASAQQGAWSAWFHEPQEVPPW